MSVGQIRQCRPLWIGGPVFNQALKFVQPKVVAYAGQRHGRADRLVDEIDRPQVQSLLLVAGVVERRQEDDRNAGGRRVVLEALAHLVA